MAAARSEGCYRLDAGGTIPKCYQHDDPTTLRQALDTRQVLQVGTKPGRARHDEPSATHDPEGIVTLGQSRISTANPPGISEFRP